MIYLTDIQTNASQYCLLNINKYDNSKKALKKIVFVDPNVMALQKHPDFPQLEKILWLADGHLQPNEYIGTDMPGDMNPSLEPIFIQKSIERNWRFKDNPQHICGVQYKWCDYADFEYRMKELEPIYAGKKKIVGLGNLCRLLVNRSEMNSSSNEYKYFKKVIEYVIRNKEKFYWIHIYGMSMYAIKAFVPLLQIYAPNIILSVDSTKWTRVCNKKLHRKYVKNKQQTQLSPTQHNQSGIGCTKATRDEFFLESMKEFQKKNIHVIY